MKENNKIKYEKILEEEKFPILVLILVGILGLGIRLYFLPFDLVLNNDGATYFWYANDVSILGKLPTEISSNIDTQFPNNGWPTFVSLFFSLINSESFLDYMNAQRVISAFISVLTIIPIYFLGKKFFNRTYSIIVATLFCFEPRLIENSLLGVTEPMYLLLGITTLVLFLNKNDKIILISFAIAALFSLVRYEGLLIIIPMTIMYFVRFHKNKKQILMYIFAIGIFIIILLPMGILRMESTGDNGLTSHIAAGGVYYSGMIEDEGNQMILEFLIKGITFLAKYFLLISIPLFLICLPYGIFNLIKRRNDNKWTLILFGIIFLIPAFYAYSRGFQDTRYLYIFIPIFSIVSIYLLQIIDDKIKKPRIFFVAIITLVIIISYIFLGVTITDYEKEREEYEISLKINQIATSVNRDYESLHFLKWADKDVLENFPILSTKVEQKDRVKIIIIGNKSENSFSDIHDYFKFAQTQGLTHLVLNNSNLENKFLQEIFQNEEEYSFLDKIYDSSESGYNTHIKIFEINYDLLLEQ
tara:strand:- start:50 stop:1636 length:1587 start_codon:yes stop_codon:yes gene_type:complete